MNESLFGVDPKKVSTAWFDEAVPADAPLAERMRPRSLEEYCGQEHLVGEGKILRSILDTGAKQSMIFWGPPGTGKTTVARLVARASEMHFVPFSAVLSGIKEIRAVMAESESERKRSGRRTLVFIDEIHRFNKAQQDAFLPYVERGDILLIGATTENPSFEVISALLSRSRVLVLEPLRIENVVAILRRALADKERGLGGVMVAKDRALEAIARASDGDARRALTLLETAAVMVTSQSRSVDDEEKPELTPTLLMEAVQKRQLHYDKGGEEHFNLISALHKSVRNSDATASVYWLTRMLESGEDRRYLARRLIRIAVEDVGLADTGALRVCLDADETYHRLGSPEGELALIQAVAYMAKAPKDNSAYKA
ncbi:MAG: replication-associated recombination protein A, partial [Planctomycetota bacterium]|nr:replication-associated recombination protein A [Planctomycetota bacterium]